MILVTGATGNVGRQAVKQLLDEGQQVAAVSRNPKAAVLVQHPAGYRRFIEEFEAAEEAAQSSGLDWTILSCADFASNTLAWSDQIRSRGAVFGAYPHAASSTIHEADAAAVAVRALTGAAHGGQAYLLTGPQSLTQPEKVDILGQAIGRRLSFVEVSPERLRQGMLVLGRPALTYAAGAADHVAAFADPTRE